jgi:sulfur dioxygenase
MDRDLRPALRLHVGRVYYLLASRRGGEALILDPVLEKVDCYLQIVRELDLRLVKAVDTAPSH